MILPRAEEMTEMTGRAVNVILSRYTTTRYCTDRYGRTYRCSSSAWSRFGRWILAGVLILVALFALFIVLCLLARKKRKNRQYTTTQTPMTAPAQQNYYGGAPQTGYNNNQYAAPSGPPPQQYGNTGANEGYHGQTQGVAQPQGAYTK